MAQVGGHRVNVETSTQEDTSPMRLAGGPSAVVDLLEPPPLLVPHRNGVACGPTSLFGEAEPPGTRQPGVGADDDRGEQPTTSLVLGRRQRPQRRRQVAFDLEFTAYVVVRDCCAVGGDLDEPVS